MIADRFDRPFLARVLDSVAGESVPWREKQLSLFAATKGSRSASDLMVVGRAVNGWDQPGFSSAELRAVGRSNAIVEAALKGTEVDRPAPLSWVLKSWGNCQSDYNTKTSAFWRTIRALATHQDLMPGADSRWPDRIIWSNLYKVAPLTAGNPSAALRLAQREAAITLLRAEIDYWRPKRVLFLTDWEDWAEPFLEDLGPVDGMPQEGHVKMIRRLPYGALAVVCQHPQGKAERQIVECALQAFGV